MILDLQTSNYNTHIAQYLKNRRQSSNEIWSVNRIYCEKYISSKTMQKVRKGD